MAGRVSGPVERHSWLLISGAAAWLLLMLATWPLALSFGDEVGYIGQTRLLLEGRFRPAADSPGMWFPGPHGLTSKYPLFPSALLLPAWVIHPRAVFAISVTATLGLVWVASKVLRNWGRDPAWALIFLAHPTIVILSRTVMADMPFACMAVLAWWALVNQRWALAAAALGLTVLVKAPGSVLAGLLIVGWSYGLWREGQARRRELIRGLTAAAVGLVIGGALTAGGNLLTRGTIAFGYDHSTWTVPVFGIQHLRTSGLAHLQSLLVCPPLLILGVWPYWSRREFGPLLVVAGFGALMAVYYFVDTAPGRLESVVLSQRLILPVVAFLLVGYADLLAELTARIHLRGNVVTAVLACAALGISLVVSERHQRWQRPMAEALRAAGAAAKAHSSELGLTYSASKVGMLFPGSLRRFVPGKSAVQVIFCGNESASYRVPSAKEGCDFAGYHPVQWIHGFVVLALNPAPSGND